MTTYLPTSGGLVGTEGQHRAGTLLTREAGQGGVNPTMSSEQLEALSMDTFNQVNHTNVGMGAWEQIQRFTRATATDTIDSVWASPLNPVNLGEDNRGDVWELASAEQREFYERNKPAIEGASAIVGGLASAVFAEAVLVPRIGAALASSTAITSSRLWQAGSKWKTESMRSMLQAQKDAIELGKQSSTLGAFGGANFLANRAAVGVGNVTRTLPFDYAVMWNNDAFNSGNLAEEAFWVSLGVGLGGVAGSIAARGIARRSMNKPWARTAMSNQIGMAGVTNSLLNTGYIDRPAVGKAGTKVDVPVHTKDSTEVTQFLIGSRANDPQGFETPANTLGIRSNTRSGYKDLAITGIGKILAKGLPGVKTATREKASGMAEIKHLVDVVAKDDPFTIFGLDEFALVDESFSKAMEKRNKHIEKMFEEANKQDVPSPESKKMAAEAARLRRQEVYAYADGTWYDPESEIVDAMRLHNDADVMSRAKMQQDSAAFRSYGDENFDITIDANLSARRGKNRINVADMNHRDRFALYRVTERLINKRVSNAQKTIIEIQDGKADDWFALDMLDDTYEKSSSLVRFNSQNTRITDRATMRRHALRLKANQLLKEVGETGAITEEHRLRYNLPAPTAMELLEDPSGDNFRLWLTRAAREDGTVQELAKGLQSARAVKGLDLLPTDQSMDPKVTGRGVNFNRYRPSKDSQENVWLRPMMAAFEPKDTISKMMQAGHDELLMQHKALAVSTLTDSRRSPHVARLAQRLTNSEAMAAAHKVNELNTAQVTGLGGRISQGLGEFLPARTKHRDNPTLLGAGRLQEEVDRAATQSYFEAVKGTGLEEALTEYSSHRGAALRAELDQFASLRPGWDIEEIVEVGDGRVGFKLSDTKTNRMLLDVDAVDEDALLTNQRTGKPVTLGEKALGVMNRYWSITDSLHKGTNTIREANNQAPIGKKEYFVPSRNTQGKRVGFVKGPDGSVVPGVAIIEDSTAAYDREVERVLEIYGEGFTVANKESIAATRDIWDMEALDWIDHGSSTALRGGQQKGGLTPAFVRDGAFLDIMDSAKGMYRTQASDTLKSLMRHPLQIARMQSAVNRQVRGERPLGQAAKDGAREGLKQAQRNIYDEYEEALTGRSKTFDETALLSKMSEAIEYGVDATLMVPVNHIADIATRWGVKPAQMRAAKNHKEIVKVLGEHSPFQSAQDWLDAQGVRKPIQVRSSAQKLNELATNLVLRWDPMMAHASLNMLGLIPTLLGNVKAGSAPATMTMAVKGKRVPMHDGLAIIKGGIADMTDVKRGKADSERVRDWKKMVENGDASQSSFEYHLMTGSTKAKSDFDVYLDKLDSSLAWASDGSENLSRQVSHFVGLRMARHQGIKDIDAQHDFAREFANAAIADYAPSNRPELYQTAFGSVFGLFQSYAVNQFSKMFHWLEKGDYAAFGVQAATQAAMFGVPTAYGTSAIFGAHDKLFQDSGEPSLMDRMYNQFGPTLGNALAHGGISEVTRIAFWTRGDMEPRMPVVTDGMMPPGIDVLRRFSNMFTGSVKTFLNQVPTDALPAAIEIVQREMPNRMLKGALGVIQGGYETDRSGNIIHENQNWFDSIMRVAGVRSARQQTELEVFYAGKADMQRDARRRAKVRNRLKTAARRAAESGSSLDPLEYFDDYVASGGNPNSFRLWFQQTARDAVNPRSFEALRKNLEVPRNRVGLWRYGGYGVWDVDDPSSTREAN